MRVKAKSKFYYSPHRREYVAGEEFEMDDRESAQIGLLCTLGTLEMVPEDAKGKPPKPDKPPASQGSVAISSDVVLTETPPMTTENTSALTGPKRFYRRRDMRPKE